jgi:hypothetical protein
VKTEGLAGSHEFRRILFAADILWHKDSADASIGKALRPSQDLLPKSVVICPGKIPEFRLSDYLFDQFPHCPLFAIQEALHGNWLETGAWPLYWRVTQVATHRRLTAVTDPRELGRWFRGGVVHEVD